MSVFRDGAWKGSNLLLRKDKPNNLTDIRTYPGLPFTFVCVWEAEDVKFMKIPQRYAVIATFGATFGYQSQDDDKKSLRAVVYKVLAHKELQKAVLALRKPTDPETDQEARITVHTLQIRAEDIVSKEWRPNWMEGSDCDDGDQRSGDHLGNEIEGKPRPVPPVIFL